MPDAFGHRFENPPNENLGTVGSEVFAFRRRTSPKGYSSQRSGWLTQRYLSPKNPPLSEVRKGVGLPFEEVLHNGHLHRGAGNERLVFR